jgi:AcrR family transcriptional regulator
MLEIIRAGDVDPSAELVAQRADVGLRTVSRHFRDMEGVYGEMSGLIAGELHAVVEMPFKAQDWRERVVELVSRRSLAFERVGPFLRASAVLRYRSTFLEANHAGFTAALRAILKRQLPPDVARDHMKVEVLDLLLSFETWSRLRREQGLAPKRAREVLEAAVRRLLD